MTFVIGNKVVFTQSNKNFKKGDTAVVVDTPSGSFVGLSLDKSSAGITYVPKSVLKKR
jgi:hypothetical protein